MSDVLEALYYRTLTSLFPINASGVQVLCRFDVDGLLWIAGVPPKDLDHSGSNIDPSDREVLQVEACSFSADWQRSGSGECLGYVPLVRGPIKCNPAEVWHVCRACDRRAPPPEISRCWRCCEAREGVPADLASGPITAGLYAALWKADWAAKFVQVV